METGSHTAASAAASSRSWITTVEHPGQSLLPLLTAQHPSRSSCTLPWAGLAVICQCLRMLLPLCPARIHHEQGLGQSPLVLQRRWHGVHGAVAHDAGARWNLTVAGVWEVVRFSGRYEGIAWVQQRRGECLNKHTTKKCWLTHYSDGI